MKRAILLPTVCLLAMLVLASVAFAQENTTTQPTNLTQVTIAAEELASGGSPNILMPAAALLLGSGILTYTILRRRS